MMNAMTVVLMAQMPRAWHDTGLFMGMHWGWWSFWILLLAVLGWGLWRVLADRTATRREEQRKEEAEEELRRRFARGELDEEEYARKLRTLRETSLGA
jgi:putative membrane protein